MNQYLNENNQNMIWKVINNAPQVITYFKKYPIGAKEQWFRSIIKSVYSQYNGSNIPLKELNKRTLDMMLQSLEEPPIQLYQQPQPPIQLQQPQQIQPQQQQMYQMQPEYNTVPSFSTTQIKTREQIVAEQFEMRKKEYESMTNKTVPKPEFTNAIKDEAINDIGSAVEEYMKQRNADIPQYVPIKPKEEIQLNIEEFPTQESKKRVQWGDNSERTFDNQQPVIDYSEKINALETTIKNMDTSLKEMFKKIEYLENTFADIKSTR
jgi:hypothetical protein